MSPRLDQPGAKLGDDANFGGMAAKIRINDGGAKPVTYYRGQRVEMEPGESLGAAYSRQHGQKSNSPTKKPVASTPTAETNYRQQVGEMVKSLGAAKAAEYVAKGFSVGEALEAELKAREVEKAQLSAAVAAKEATDRERARQDLLTAELQKQRTELEQLRGVANGEQPKRKGFAGKLRFGGSFSPFGKSHTQKPE